MKNRKTIILSLIVSIIFSSVCFGNNLAPLVEDHSFGTYIVSNDFIKAQGSDLENTYVYCANGDQNKFRPNNVMVRYGTNNYSLAQINDFKDGILRVLNGQLGMSGLKPSDVQGSGTYTKNGYPLISLRITMPDGTYQVQNYIVRDYSYVYVALWCSDNTKSSVAEEVTSGIIDSFVFK